MRRLTLSILAVALLAAPAVAQAVPKHRPWATINVCDTDRKRNVVGVRAGMPGNGTRQRMRMRFVLQWLAPAEEEGERRRWTRTGRPSKWVAAGSARFRQAQRGWSFGGIADPPAGERFRLRGVVLLQWRAVRERKRSGRRRVVVVRRARWITRGGLKGVVGGRPPGRSDAVCVVEGAAVSGAARRVSARPDQG
ncbi:MAG: hypothetical protein WD993_09270 [Thermoleophilaceae bacterium]